MIFGVAAMAAAETNATSFDARTSRSTHLFLSGSDDSSSQSRKMGRQKRIRLRYDRPVQVGGSDVLLRFKAPLKKKKLLAFEVIF
jgi:hypothetical protein